MNKVTYKEILNNIRNIIFQKGMKHCVVAEKAGFTRQELSNILNGHKLLRVEYIPKLAESIGVEISDLFPIKKCPAEPGNNLILT